jgi:hypothetical protein
MMEDYKQIGGALPATPRHMSSLLRLLPSRPDRVNKVSLRGDRKVTIEKL